MSETDQVDNEDDQDDDEEEEDDEEEDDDDEEEEDENEDGDDDDDSWTDNDKRQLVIPTQPSPRPVPGFAVARAAPAASTNCTPGSK